MKKIVKAIISSVLAVILIMSLSSCGMVGEMISNIKERARLASELVILDSPDDSALADVFNRSLEVGKENCIKITEDVELNIGKPSVESDSEDAQILKKTADMLKKIILEEAPGSSSRELSSSELSDTLLKNIQISDVVSAASERNSRDVAVTDENGKDVLDEDGIVVREPKVADNYLTSTFRFYTENTRKETGENGEETEVTDIVPADDGMIEKYFGEIYSKEEILAEFDKIKEYFKVSDYNLEYTDCRIKAKTDMNTDEPLYVTYEKNFKVTAEAEGVGPFSDIGAFTVTFTGSENTEYTFDYIEDED